MTTTTFARTTIALAAMATIAAIVAFTAAVWSAAPAGATDQHCPAGYTDGHQVEPQPWHNTTNRKTGDTYFRVTAKDPDDVTVPIEFDLDAGEWMLYDANVEQPSEHPNFMGSSAWVGTISVENGIQTIIGPFTADTATTFELVLEAQPRDDDVKPWQFVASMDLRAVKCIPDPEPTPTETSTWTPSPTPTPSDPTPTPTSTPTATPTMTPSPGPSPSLTPSPTSKPSETPSPTQTPDPSPTTSTKPSPTMPTATTDSPTSPMPSETTTPAATPTASTSPTSTSTSPVTPSQPSTPTDELASTGLDLGRLGLLAVLLLLGGAIGVAVYQVATRRWTP